jgi:hypothetical protein
MPLSLNGSGGITYPDGSVNTTRSVSVAGDTMTGLLNLPSNGLSVGTNQLRVSGGNVGIGISNPNAALEVVGAAGGGTTNLPSGTLVLRRNGGPNLGDYGPAITFGQYWFTGSTDVIATGQISGVRTTASGNFGGGLAFFRCPVGSSSFSEAMRIEDSGRIQINTTAGNKYSAALTIVKGSSNSYNITSSVTGTGSEGHVVFENGNANAVGTIFTNASSTSYNTSSDYRLKENIAPMTGALDVVQTLKPVTYNWKVDGSNGQGFIAHELQAVAPECVTGEKDAVERLGNILDAEGKVLQENVQEPTEENQIAGQTWVYTKDLPRYQGVDTSFLVATLVSAIQEQQAIIQSLTARIEALEAV